MNARLFRNLVLILLGSSYLLPITYFLSALALCEIAFNRAPPASSSMVTIFVISNGVHTEVVVPVKHKLYDWTGIFPYRDFREVSDAQTHIAIGMADRNFILTTPGWSDLSLATAVNALFLNSPTIIHATYISNPYFIATVYPVNITPDQYLRLTSFIISDLQLNADNQATRIPWDRYGPHESFYAAKGQYNLINTCNQWTGRALKAADIKTGLWTPFAFSVVRHLLVQY